MIKNKLYILTTLLALAIIILSVSFYNYRETAEIKFQESENLRILKLEEENNLRSELDDILEQYDNFRDEIDNLNIDLDQKQSEINDLKAEIRELLNTKQDLALARKKIGILQNIAKKYFAQVDSLLGKTEELQIQNNSLLEENTNIKSQNATLNIKNLDLNARLDVGSVLEVSDIEIDKIKYSSYGVEKKVIRTKNIQVLRCCFKISANAIAKAENKKVYIQYISPSGELLKSSHTPVESTFSIGDSAVHSTILDSFDYNNKEIEMCVDWQRGNMLESGRYSILIYIEEKLVGNSSLKLN
ncbi:MAG: hypothetical protein CMD22_00190 [Flavobacteriales bacterium]|nr:hypothetical protein [Flavobacteriales bacterium]|tara:strand:+ start:6580 stop:7482 length:903 start_codon:yes stop_codon:yes gene_type:complete